MKVNMLRKPSQQVVLALALFMMYLNHPSEMASAIPRTQASEAREKPLTFEVVSIRKSKSELPSGETFTGDGFSVNGFPAFFLISLAYDFRDFDRLHGLPEWCFSDKYDIHAKIADSDISEWRALSANMKASALQALLADRFGLRLHQEHRDGNVYDLVIAKTGLKIKKAMPRPTPTREASGLQMAIAHILTMDQLASELPNHGLSRPVINRTGLTGSYDCHLRIFNEDPSLTRPSDASIRSDVHDQLGLDLRSTKGQIEILIVDHIDRPSAN